MERLPAHVYAVLAVGLLTLSASAILIRYAGDASPLAIATWRTAFAVVLLLPFSVRRAIPTFWRLPTRDKALVVAGGTFLSLHWITWIASVGYTSVASATVLVTTSPLFLAALGYLLLKERLRLRTVVAIIVAVGGAVLIAVGDASDARFPRAGLGNALAIAAALLVSFYLLVGRAVRQRLDWLAYVFPLYAVAALVTLVVALVLDAPLKEDAGFYLLCLGMAIGPSILGHGSFNYALRFLPAAVLGLLSLAEPVGSAALAFFLFGEVPTPLGFVGMAVVLGAIAVVVSRRTPRGGETDLPGAD